MRGRCAVADRGQPRRMPPQVPTPRRELLLGSQLPAQVRRDLRNGRSVAVVRGVHVGAELAQSYAIRCAAVLRAVGEPAVIGQQSSAVLLDLPWVPASWREPRRPIDVVVGPSPTKRRDRAGIRLHERHLPADEITVVGGIPCLSVERTLVELARDPRMPDLLVVQLMDGALRRGRTSRARLEECADRLRGYRYVARARLLIANSRDGVDSPPETTLRLAVTTRDFEPDVGIEIRDHDGVLLARCDLGSRRFLLWSEYDGFVWHRERPAFRGDRIGDRWLRRRGWEVMRFVDTDLQRLDAVRREWQQAIADAPARIAALDPARSPEVRQAQQLLGIIR
jgi:hypothetical protein